MEQTMKELRKSVGVSQTVFAGTLHIPLRTLQHWEEGTRKPPEYLVNLITKWVTEGNFAEELEIYQKEKRRKGL